MLPRPQKYRGILLNAFSRHYREASDEWTNDHEMRLLPELVHKRLKLPENANVLDVGCGSGRDVEYLSSHYAFVDGIDIFSHHNWEQILLRVSNVSFTCVELLSYDTKKKYDLILDNGCLHHQHPDETSAYLRRIADLLGHGSYFVLSTFKNPALAQRIDENGRLHKYFDDRELHNLLAAADLTLFREQYLFRPVKGDHYRISFCRAE